MFSNSCFEYLSIESYKYYDSTSSIRIGGAKMHIGHARNELLCFDLKDNRIVWVKFLDAPLVNFIQLHDIAIALSYASISAFNIKSGALLWQFSLENMKVRSPARLSRSMREWTWPSSDAMEMELEIYGKKKPVIAYSIESSTLWAWPGKGSIIAIDLNSGEVKTSVAVSESSQILALACSGPFLFTLDANRKFSAFSDYGELVDSVFLSEGFGLSHGKYLSTILFAQPGVLGTVCAWTSSHFAVWNPSKKELIITEGKYSDNGLCYPTVKGVYSFRSGLSRQAISAKQPPVLFEGKSITAWIGIIPYTAACVLFPYEEITIGSFDILPVWQGNTLWFLDSSDLIPLQEITLPGMATEGVQMLMSMVRGAWIPPFYDVDNRRAYFIISSCTEKEGSDSMFPKEISDYLVTLSWK
jgi:hypothetical protein